MLSQIDLDLLRKYDRPGPRYTSYPTAPHFHTGFTHEDFVRQQEEALRTRAQSPLSLYFHVPYCIAICAYCGCHTSATNKRSRIDAYSDSLRGELDSFAARFSHSRPVKQIHFGGGTPTHVGMQSLQNIMDGIRQHFSLSSDAEVAIEIDPRRIQPGTLADLRRMGFNRVSFGIQDLDPKVQKAVGRIQSPELCAETVREAHAEGFRSVNIDLIYGLPYQTVESQKRTLDFVVENIRPDRMAVFNFAYLPHLRENQQGIDPNTLPPADVKLRLLKQAIETFTSADYDFIGLDHFARPSDPLAQALRNGQLHRNFQGYTTLSGAEIVGFGVSSISQFEGAYCQNTKDEDLFHERVRAGLPTVDRGIILTADDKLRRHVIMTILCQGKLVKSEVEKQFGIQFDTTFADAMAALPEFAADGLLNLTNDALEITPMGRLFIRNVAMAFDGRMGATSSGSAPTYSRTV